MQVGALGLRQVLSIMPRIPKQERRKMPITLNTIRLRNVSHTVQSLIKPTERSLTVRDTIKATRLQVGWLMSELRLIERGIEARNE